MIPFSSDPLEKGLVKTLFSFSTSTNEVKELKNFEQSEKIQLEKLNLSLKKVSEYLKNSKDLKELKNKKMEELFKSIFELEVKLINLYKKHSEIIQKLSELSSKILSQNEESIKTQSNLQKASYYKNLLEQLSLFLGTQEKLLQTVITEIDNNKNKNSQDSSSVGGGKDQKGTEARQEAEKTLEDVRKNFSLASAKIKEMLSKAQKENDSLLLKKLKLEIVLSNIERNIFLLKWSSIGLEVNSQETSEEINRLIDQLNIFRKELSKTYGELKYAKDKILVFQNYNGKIKNSICKNTQNSDKSNCDLSFLNSSKP